VCVCVCVCVRTDKRKGLVNDYCAVHGYYTGACQNPVTDHAAGEPSCPTCGILPLPPGGTSVSIPPRIDNMPHRQPAQHAFNVNQNGNVEWQLRLWQLLTSTNPADRFRFMQRELWVEHQLRVTKAATSSRSQAKVDGLSQLPADSLPHSEVTDFFGGYEINEMGTHADQVYTNYIYLLVLHAKRLASSGVLWLSSFVCADKLLRRMHSASEKFTYDRRRSFMYNNAGLLYASRAMELIFLAKPTVPVAFATMTGTPTLSHLSFCVWDPKDPEVVRAIGSTGSRNVLKSETIFRRTKPARRISKNAAHNARRHRSSAPGAVPPASATWLEVLPFLSAFSLCLFSSLSF
jgi:hypothetical protein